MTEQVFNFIIHTRKAFIELVNSLSIEELNEIPAGFNNNIIWNFGHIVVSTQTLSYVRTGIWPDATAVQYNEDYRKGTKPIRFVPAEEVEVLKSLALSTIERIERDYQAGIFKQITPFATSTYGAEMVTYEEVLAAAYGHDNLHYGYALAQRRSLL